MTAAPYDEVVRLGERELELIAGGALEEAERVQARRGELLDSLPPSAPAAARAALERAAVLQADLTAALAARLRELRAELEHADRGRRAARSYGAGPAAAPRVDHAA